ncbi:MAG: hypothetical protein HDT40_10195 [Lachnospiraceae bacterium]|nr:hypothetical protein [Lachnospiraceae bacterium]
MEKKTKLDTAKKEVVKVDVSYERFDEDIDRAIEDKRCAYVNAFLGQLFNILDIGRNVKKVVDPNIDYVVKFTPELLKKMEEHDIKFLRDKLTGELLPDLYDYTEKRIGGKVRLEIRGEPTGQDLSNLSNAINNLIGQQRYEALVEEIQQLHIVAKRIERGQDNDRFAKVNAGRNHLLDALNYQGAEEEKKKFIIDALAMLREGRELIEKTLIDKLDALEDISESKIKRLWTCFSHSDYFDKQIGRYEDIQEYFQYYYMSIQPMAYAYTYLNQPQLIEGLLEDSRKVFEHDKLRCLSTVEYLLPDGRFDGIWYKSPEIYEQKLLEAYKAREKNEDLYITVKGCAILEVLDNGRKEN